MSQLKRLLANALDSKKILTEVGSGPSALLQSGGRSVAASARVQVWLDPIVTNIAGLHMDLKSMHFHGISCGKFGPGHYTLERKAYEESFAAIFLRIVLLQ